MSYKHHPLPPQKRQTRKFRFLVPPEEAAFLFGRRRGDPVTTALILGGIGAGAGVGAATGMFGGDDPEPAPSAYTPPTDTGAAKDAESVDAQAAQRRLARLSKYFTSPTGVLDAPTGSSGVF